jgi:hypothetical protein
MNEKRKPQGINLGYPSIDGESITDNVISIDSLSAKSKYVFGKSAPTVTAYDILERELLPDSDYCSAMERAEEHLRALGFLACWLSEDVNRYHLHKIKRDVLRNYWGKK